MRDNVDMPTVTYLFPSIEDTALQERVWNDPPPVEFVRFCHLVVVVNVVFLPRQCCKRHVSEAQQPRLSWVSSVPNGN